MSPQPVPDDGRITDPGEYVLEGDRRVEGIVPASEAMLHIAADDVTLDGQGHAVVGNGVSDTVGIETAPDTRTERVTIRDIRLTAWEVGIAASNVASATLEAVEATQNSYGVRLTGVDETAISDATIRGNLIGVGVGPASSFDDEGAIGPNQLADVQRADDCE